MRNEYNLDQGRKYQRLLSWFITMILVSGFFVWQLTFGTQNNWGYLNTGTHFSLKWLIAVLITYGMRMFGGVGMLWGMTYFTQRLLTFADTLKVWVEVVVMGISVSFVSLALNAQFWHKTWYDAIFLLTRNAMPMVTGLIIFTMIQPWVQKVARDRRFAFLVLGLLTLDLVFPTDVLKLGNGTSFLGVVLLGCLALIMSQRSDWLSWRTLILPVIGVISIAVMAWAQATRQMQMSDALRFVTVLSPLTVLPAAWVTQHLNRWTGKALSHSALSRHWMLVAMLLATGSVFSHVLGSLVALLKAHVHNGLLWVMVGTILLLVASLVVAVGLRWWLHRQKLWQRLEQYWSSNIWQISQQVVSEPQAIIKRVWLEYWRPITAFLTFYVVQAISILLMSESLQMKELITHKTDSIFSTILLSYNFKILGGALLLGAAYWIIQGLTNRYWLSLLSVSAFALFFAVASRLKILSRATPILPSDMAELGSIKEIMSLVNPVVIAGIVIGVLVILGTMVWLELHATSAKQRPLARVIKVALGLVLLGGLGSMNGGYSFTSNVLQAFGMYMEGNPNMLLYAQTNGPITTFVSQLDVKVMDEPKGYSKAEIKRVVTKYQKRATTINLTRSASAKELTVLFNLSESFADPTRIPGVKLNQDPIPYINHLKQQTTSGLMLSAGYGGGTANMEYESLSGMSMGLLATGAVIPNNQIVPSENTAVNFGDQFTYASAIHPYTGGYYNRISVYRKYGFQKFAYLGSQYPIIDQKRLGSSMYLSDTTAYANALKQIKSRQNGQLINLITMQNHMPYTSDVYKDHNFKVSGSMSQSEKVQIEHYSQGISYTDQAVKVFKKQLDRLNKPVIWVFYGDHLPGIYDIGTSVVKYSTDYFIYANKYARAHGAQTQLIHSKYVSTNDFISMALKTGNAKVDAYSALLSDIQTGLPTLWQSLDASDIVPDDQDELHFVTQAGKVVNTSKLSNHQKTLLHDYQLIQYDLVAGKQYSLQDHMTTTVKKTK